MEWLTMTGWTVEVSDGPEAIVGTATRDLYGETLEVNGAATTREGVAWALVEQAEAELERWEDRQQVAVAA